MFCRLFQQLLLVGLACVGGLVPARAAEAAPTGVAGRAIGELSGIGQKSLLSPALSSGGAESEASLGPLTNATRSAAAEPKAFRVRRWTTDDGLPQNRIGCLKQTRDGYLWIGTWNGVARFDGMKFTVFNKANTPELASDAISALAEDPDGTLWMGTREGLVSYRDHHFQRFSTAEALLDGKVWQLASARGGGLWLQSGRFVARFAGGQFSRGWEMPFGGRILSLQERSDGWLNVFTDSAWLALSPQADQMRTNCVRDNPFRDWQAALSANQSNSFWVGTRAGLLLVEQGVERPVIQDQTWGRSVDFLYRDRSGAVWMSGHSGELDFWDGQRWTAVDAGEGSTALSVICMEEDREGSLWMGTDQGLVQLRKSPVRTFTMRDGLAGDNAWSVCQSKDGTIWVGTDRGVSCIRADRVARLAAAGPLPESQARCLWPNPAGGVWIAKQGAGLQEFQDGAFFQRIVPNALPVLVSALYQDRSDRLLIGSAEGVLQFQRGEVTPLAVPTTEQPGKRPDFPAPASLRGIQAILEDRQGALWFGTKSQGLARLAQGVVTMFNRRDGLSHNSVWAIYEAADGALWLGTEGGLTRYRNGKCFVFSRQHGLGEETVNCVLEDDFGFLYLSGLHGILRIKRAELDAVADGRAAAVRSLTLGTGDGMESAETNGEIQPAGWKARDGRLWFCTIRGVVVIDPKAIPSEEAPPPVLVEQVKADEEVVFGDGGKAEVGGQKAQAGGQRSESHFQLRAGHGHVVEFRYTANTFVASERARFRYRLLGANRDWREETSERTARYINLKPGKYRFEVTAADHHGIWNPVPASFGFSLVPRFWQTWTFYVLCGSGVIGLAAGLQAYRLRWQRRLLKLEEQRALATERTRIARDLHDDLGTALTGLALELDVAGRQAKEVAPLAGRLSEAAQRTRDLAERMREVVWTVNPKCDTVSSLASFLEQQVSQFLRADGLRLRLDFPEDIPELPLGAEARHELALSVREALTNVVRHAQATEVTLSLAITDQTLRVQVKDNGRGFRQCQTNAHGLANMKARMERVRGSFECLCAPDGGTAVTFRLPLGQPAKQLAPNEA